jgi:hypothetical protein
MSKVKSITHVLHDAISSEAISLGRFARTRSKAVA